MKLLEDLFEIVESTPIETGFTTTIRLFPGHIIYSGHFPGHPITPGVVQLQIVHELMENHLGKSLKLVTVDDCKFLKIIDPEETNEVQISVEYVLNNSLLHVKAAGKYDIYTFLKLKGSYLII